MNRGKKSYCTCRKNIILYLPVLIEYQKNSENQSSFRKHQKNQGCQIMKCLLLFVRCCVICTSTTLKGMMQMYLSFTMRVKLRHEFWKVHICTNKSQVYKQIHRLHNCIRQHGLIQRYEKKLLHLWKRKSNS